MLQRLKDEHRQILRIMARVETTLFPSDTPQVVQIGEARWETQHILRDHFAFKDAFVFRVLAQSGRPKAVVTARRLQAFGLTIREAYHCHLERWDPADMASSWAAYRSASLEMIAQLRELIEMDKRDLYPLMESDAGVPKTIPVPSFGVRIGALA